MVTVVFSGLRGVVDDLAGEHRPVRDGDVFILDRADPGDQQGAFDHVAHGLADPDPITDLERPGVGQHHAGDDVAHCSRRAQREQHANKERNALERVGSRTREVGEHDHGRESED
jgi:hypothetical protein